MISNIGWPRPSVHTQVINKLSTLKLESGKRVKVTQAGKKAIKKMKTAQAETLLNILKNYPKTSGEQQKAIHSIVDLTSNKTFDSQKNREVKFISRKIQSHINTYNSTKTASRSTGNATKLQQQQEASRLREAKPIAYSKKELKETSRTIGNMVADVWKDVKFFFACLAINAQALFRGAKKNTQELTKDLPRTQKQQGLGTQLRRGANDAWTGFKKAAGQAADATLGSGPVSDAWYAQGIDKKAQRQINKLYAEYFVDKTVTWGERGLNNVGDKLSALFGERIRRDSAG
ncbi:hypothetical protein N9N03_01855 [Chlamydiia bacterium]|nr:hypothetical protein [Chlamydiia bacterium]